MKPASTGKAPPPAHLLAAPSPYLPLAFFLPGLAALLSAGALLVALAPKLSDWYYQQEVLALVHTLTLGFLLAVLLGASVQLLPVISGVTLERTALVKVAGAVFFAGALGMVAHFWKLRWPGLLVSATAVVVAVILFLVAALPALARAPDDAVRLGFVLAFSGLALTITLGLLMGFDRHRAFLPGAPLAHLTAHLHVGVLATFATAIFAVEGKLLPMFLVAPPPPERRQKAALGLLFFGTLLLSTAIWFGWAAIPFALIPVAAIPLQIANVRGILKARKRREVDVGFRYALSAYVDLVAAAAVGLVWASGVADGTLLSIRLAYVYVFLLLVGFVLQTVIGILSKILPFLVWQAVYARRVGLARVPTLKEMSSARLLEAGFWLFRIGSVAMALALLRGRVPELRIAAALLATSFVPTVLHAALALVHLRHLGGSTPLPTPKEAPLAAG